MVEKRNEKEREKSGVRLKKKREKVKLSDENVWVMSYM